MVGMTLGGLGITGGVGGQDADGAELVLMSLGGRSNAVSLTDPKTMEGPGRGTGCDEERTPPSRLSTIGGTVGWGA